MEEIKNSIIQELCKMNIEDLEKLINEKEQEDILNFFTNTYNILQGKTVEELKNISDEIVKDTSNDESNEVELIEDNKINVASEEDTSNDESNEVELIEDNKINVASEEDTSNDESNEVEKKREREYAGKYPRKKVGIKNTGVSCYANSAIQMLYSLPFYRKHYTEIIVEDNVSRLVKITGKDDSSVQRDLNVIKNLFILMNNTADNRSIDTNKSNCNLTIDIKGQQDPSEYLMLRPYIINDENKYEEKIQYKCLNSHDWTDAPNNINYIVNITINDHSNNINDCLNNFMHKKYDTEHPIDRTCIEVNRTGEIEEEKISIIPSKENRYFFIMLNRTIITKNDNGQIKVIKSDRPIEPNKTLRINNIDYTLSGTIVHIGPRVDVGHYIYYQCNEKGEYNTNYNDSAVVDFEESIQYIQHSTDSTDSPYINETDFINRNAAIFAYTRYPV
jgi:hypothetical protein